MSRAAIVLVCALVTTSLPRVALAQATTPSEEVDRATARGLFTEGIRAAQEGRWADARSLFERSYALVPRPITLLNLAGALAQTLQLVESAEAYRRFLAEAADGPAARHRDAAQSALTDVQSRIPTLRLRIEGGVESDRVSLDGQALTADALGSPIAVNPGRHEVRVERASVPARIATIEVTERERATVVIDARLGAPGRIDSRAQQRVGARSSVRTRSARTAGARGRSPGAESSWVSSPWLWLAVGAAAIAGGIALGVVASQPSRAPTTGDIPPFRQGL